MQLPAQATGKVVVDADALARTLSRIAHEIIERNDDLGDVALVGIHTRGVPIAQRLRRLIDERAGLAPDLRAAAAAAPDLGPRPDTRRRRTAARDRAHLRALARARGEEAPDAPRPDGREPLLRVVDANLVQLRARGEAPLRGHDVDQGGRLL